jgi:hypothetical protein
MVGSDSSVIIVTVLPFSLLLILLGILISLLL